MGIQPKDSRTSFLDGGGKMSALMRGYDWNRTPLGDPADWPTALKSAIATCLSSQFPMVVWWGPQLLMLYNDAWQPILGDTKHPAGLGRPGKESWPDTWPIVGAQFENALKGVASWFEDLLLASDRHGFIEESYFTYSHSPLKDASGDVVGVLSVVSETTARVLNARRLQTLARLSNATIEGTRRLEPLADMCQRLVDTLCRDNPDAPFAVQYLVDSSQRVRRIALAGLDAARVLETVEGSDQDAWGIAEVLRSRSNRVLRFAASEQLPGGIWPEPTTELLVLPLFDSGLDAKLCGILVVGVNSRLRLDTPYIEFLRLVAAEFGSAISALQFVHREREARDEAKRAARMRDEFLAMLSHELRNPLAPLANMMSVLELKDDDAGLRRRALFTMRNQLHHIMRLVDDLLDVSRISRGVLELERQPVDLTSVLSETVEAQRPFIEKADRVLSVVLPSQPIYLSGDSVRLIQIFDNLLDNARKYTRPGGHIGLTVALEGTEVLVNVMDDGIGIPKSELQSVFDLFTQLDRKLENSRGGLGIGLALVKRLVEMHGGSVVAISDGKDQGAQFGVRLPVLVGPANLPATTNRAAVALPQRRIMVVDDNRDNADSLYLVLKLLGQEAYAVHDGLEAIKVAERLRPEMILLDIGMPGLNGLDVCKRIRQKPWGKNIKLVAVTGWGQEVDRRRTSEAGFDVHLVKPVAHEDIIRLLSQRGETNAN
jgi:signal transduction histidine kinase/ActR/RegA family two-component response regulator